MSHEKESKHEKNGIERRERDRGGQENLVLLTPFRIPLIADGDWPAGSMYKPW